MGSGQSVSPHHIVASDDCGTCEMVISTISDSGILEGKDIYKVGWNGGIIHGPKLNPQIVHSGFKLICDLNFTFSHVVTFCKQNLWLQTALQLLLLHFI